MRREKSAAACGSWGRQSRYTGTRCLVAYPMGLFRSGSIINLEVVNVVYFHVLLVGRTAG